MTTAGAAELVPVDLGPGAVPSGFAEIVLAKVREVVDPAEVWNGATSLAGYAQKWNGHGREKREIKSAQMFCEIELGQLLGPNPGQGSVGAGRPSQYPHADTDIPAQRIKDLRRFYGHRDLLVEAVRNGGTSRRSLLLIVDRAEADTRPATEQRDLDIRRGDFRDVFTNLPPVTLILTDPPYPAEYLPLWADLGKFAADALIPGGSLIAYSGQSNLPDVLDRLRPHLRYWWTIALLHQHGSDMIPGKWVSAGWKPLVWFVNDHRMNQAMLADRINGSSPRKTVPTGDSGDWAQGIAELEPIVSALTAPGDLIVDPFAGSGTVGIAAHRFGRQFVGADLDPSSAQGQVQP